MNIFSGIEYKVLKDVNLDRKYDGIEYDSRKIKENYIFIAFEGANVDGHNYIDSAVKNGATCIIVSKKVEMKHNVSYVLVEDIRHKLGYIASNFYEWPQRKLKIIGVTGTNGKTSSTYMIEKLMGDIPITRIGTIEYKIGDEVFEAVNTTPESLDLIKIFDKTLKKKIEYVVMEVSSHSLEIGRVEVVDFDYALFTNLTQDHLDYHITMENYFQAKRKLFLKLKDINNSVINIDDKYGKRLYDEFIVDNPEIISYGIDGGDLEGDYLDDGYIEVDGKNINNLAKHKRGEFISKVYQNPALGTAPSMTIFENLSMADNKGKTFGLSLGLNYSRKEYYMSLLKELDLGLENLLDTEVQYLSGGQRQCLALIMATLNQPKVLLLDEHTAALDPKTSKIIMDKTEEIVKKSEIPTLMITHNLQDAIRYGNRLIMLHNGEIILDIKGKEKEELTQDALMEIFQKKATYSDVI